MIKVVVEILVNLIESFDILLEICYWLGKFIEGNLVVVVLRDNE